MMSIAFPLVDAGESVITSDLVGVGSASETTSTRVSASEFISDASDACDDIGVDDAEADAVSVRVTLTDRFCTMLPDCTEEMIGNTEPEATGSLNDRIDDIMGNFCRCDDSFVMITGALEVGVFVFDVFGPTMTFDVDVCAFGATGLTKRMTWFA